MPPPATDLAAPADGRGSPARAAGGPSPPVPSEGDQVVVTDVHKAFGATKALDGCDFSARRGEIHAVVGGNGCGKSTLAKALSGVLPVDSGHVSVMGISPGSPREARLAGIATVFQEVFVADDCSVVDNLYVGSDTLWVKHIGEGEKRDTGAALIRELTGLDLDPNQPVGDLPLSVKQWITIGRALLIRPKVLILDESSAALDLDSTERLFAKIRELKAQGCAVIIVTHRIAELIRVSDRATIMRNGRTVGVLDRGDVTEANILRMMTGREDASGGESSHPVAGRDSGDDVVMRVRRGRMWPGADPFDFDLSRGEIVGVAGLDGQGQDEFVRFLAGVQAAEEGGVEIRADGGGFHPVRDLDDARRRRIAYVSGDRKREGIFPNLSIFENMLIPLYRARNKGGVLGIVDWPSLGTVFENGIRQLSVKIGYASDKITSLSGGNQQKVLVGRALAIRPRVLVLNDPARGIDVEAKRELYGHLRDFAARGDSIVFMSSEIEEFIGLCNRVVVFRHGSVFDVFAGDGVQPVPIFEAMFGQSRNRAPVPGRGAASLAGRGPGREGGPAAADVAPEARPPRAAPPAPRDIRVVEFGREGVVAERPGRGDGPADGMRIVEFGHPDGGGGRG